MIRSKIDIHLVLFVLILLMGIFARTWEFGTLPAGLMVDEASSGADAKDLLHFGVDRYGISYPVHFFGSGENPLYTYLLIPFIALGGLNPITVRLPMLISGLLAMPLMYFVGKRIGGKTVGLLAMFLLAISPWHIMLSRWGIDNNILPFVFLCGYSCFLKSEVDNWWFVTACLFFGLCLYAYGTAYAAVPVFLLCAVPILWLAKRVRVTSIAAGLILLLIVGWPVGVFIAVNSLRLQTLHIGLFTIPRLPTAARYESIAAIFSNTPFQDMIQNLRGLLKLLWYQNDGLNWNSFGNIGYFYGRFDYGSLSSRMIVAPVTFAGAVMTLPFRRTDRMPERLLLLSWLAASFVVGILQPVSFNRINLIFIPLLLFIAIFLDWLGKHLKILLTIFLCALMVCFVDFNYEYHGEIYRNKVAASFKAGIIPALEFARNESSGPICINNYQLQYIYVLFSDPMSPSDYLPTVRYLNPDSPLREMSSVGRYAIGLDNCPINPNTVFVLRDQKPPSTGIRYQSRCFEFYCVYTP